MFFYLVACAAMVCFELFITPVHATADSKQTPPHVQATMVSHPSASKKTVLVLGSYDSQNVWSQVRVSHFAAAISEKLNSGVEVRAELIESDPRLKGTDRFRHTLDALFSRYLRGYKQDPVDVIVVTDHESLNFMLEVGRKVFKDVPTVFCCVGKPSQFVFEHRDLYTGEFQVPDIKTNVDLAFAQCPDARKMMVVIDDSEWGEFLYDQLQTIKRGYTHRRFYYLKSADYNSKQLLEKLKTLSKDVVVLWASWKQDKDGTVSSWKSVLVEASQVCPVPIYGIESSMLGNGIVGGKLLVIENQSQKAAKMVQQILAGASPKDIPIQNDSVTSYMFDYTQLTRWEINLSEIPPDSYVIHRPGFDFLSNQAIFWGASALLFIIAVACTLIISVRYRRHAETQWRRTEQRFSFIYEQSPLAYQSLDPKGRILSVNRAWSELLGYGANEAVGRKFAEFLAPDSKRVFLEYWDQCTEPDLGEIRIDLPSIEIKLVSHYGHVVPVLFYLRKAYDPIDRTTAFYSAMHDISQRREAEDTLRQEDIRLNSLLTLNQMLDSSIEDITDYAIRASLRLTESERGYLAFVNENEETLTLHAWGFERNGVYYVLNESKTLPSNTTGLWDGILEKREPILINDTHSPNPSWHRFGENSYLPGRRLCVPVFDKDRIVAVASVANKQQEYAEHDIQQLTLLLEGMWRIIERKKTTDKLHEYTNNLESANRQLEECSLAAQQASRAKSEFLANMSHEIRTPMTAIIGFTELLRTEGDITKAPPARIEAIDTVNRNANYLLFLLNDILDLSKIEAGHLQIETDNCELPGLINDVTKLMETRAIAKGLILDVDTAEDVPEAIYTDSYRLRQILLNLLGNAVKFTNQGMVRLVVSRKRQKAGEDRVFFEVIDTGIGISQDKMEQIFDPFTQADSSTSRQFGGTGLGLCISRKLARMLGGELYVESELDVGSIFTLAIPCISKVEERANDESFRHAVQTKCGLHDANQVEPTPQDMSDMLDCHVLVVDDGIDNRRLISAFLDRAGATITLCENGELACELLAHRFEEGNKLAENPVDVILMDMQMPVMDGYQATRRLRQEGYEGPVIAITANAMKKDRDKCIEVGCDDYLSKPIDRASLIETVATYAKREKQRRATAAT